MTIKTIRAYNSRAVEGNRARAIVTHAHRIPARKKNILIFVLQALAKCVKWIPQHDIPLN